MTLKFQKLEEDFLSLLTEFNTVKCKLECKTDSLLILSQELEKCKLERDQYKLMADQLRTRYSALKRRVEGWGPSLMGVYDVDGLKCEREKSLVQLLCELKEQNKALKYESQDLKQQLIDAQGDIRILRDESLKKNSDVFQECSSYVSLSEKEVLIKQLEVQKLKCIQLTKDLEALLDEKEELVSARDQYRQKFERLNQQLNYVLRGDSKKTVDIDGVLMENKYLRERIQQVEEEKAVTASALEKCRAVIEKKRSKGGMRSTIASGIAISARQVEQFLQSTPFLDFASKSSNGAEFRNLILTVFESLNDKTIALSHQRKTNKILGHRVAELEERIKSMEVSTLWKIPDPSQFALLLHSTSELTEMDLPLKAPKTLDPSHDKAEDLTEDQRKDEPSERNVEFRSNSGFSDLDILPTRDDSIAGILLRQESMSSCSFYSDSKVSSESFSPVHIAHSDSEATPKRTSSSSRFRDRHEWSSVDLPENLQKLVATAMAEIDHEVRSPVRSSKSPVNPASLTESPDSC